METKPINHRSQICLDREANSPLYNLRSPLSWYKINVRREGRIGPINLEGNPGATVKSIAHAILVTFVWDLTEETIDLPLGFLQGGVRAGGSLRGRDVCLQRAYLNPSTLQGCLAHKKLQPP